ncbi:hypothetical protein BP5796_12986 [Coleophoma crateriformis]|uniref:Xylanolytic transcriptional activator regulatory domain-containing protein n=1 Tax=Coleophoma crateriformis TaxID=565419 RepID=A0A3D8Q519_9HELO|nr:hypothetical protein BP5796_12986 [Coleophoma crateriformis]
MPASSEMAFNTAAQVKRGGRPQDIIGEPSINAESSISDSRDLVKSMAFVMLGGSHAPRFMGTSSGITLAKMVVAAIRIDPSIPLSTTVRDPDFASASGISAAASSLPPRRAADHIVDVYFQHRTPHFPILEREQVKRAVDKIYSSTPPAHGTEHSRMVERDLFTAYMVFAIGLCGMSIGDIGRPLQSEGCFNSAVRYLDSVLTFSKNDLETLTTVLLLAQYVALCPCKGSLWQLTGMALRICIDMGLHWETESVLNMDPVILDARRRLFWTTYNFDRMLSITLGRPFGIVDPSISTALPNPFLGTSSFAGAQNKSYADDSRAHYKRIANHVTALYRLRSEIKHVLYHQLQGTTLAYPRPNYSLWIRDIQPRLQEWQASIPSLSEAHPQSIFASQAWWSATYSNTLLLLHRPNPLIQSPSLESLRICFDASCKAIQCIKALQREQKIAIIWIWTHHLVSAGLTAIYCLWHSAEIRENTSIDHIMNTMQSCTSILSALAERFPGATGCRNAFEALSAATLKWCVEKDPKAMQQKEAMFNSFLPANYQPASGYDSFELQMQPLHVSAEELLLMFPNDGLGLRESLSMAAQWPISSNFDFTMDLESMDE